MGGIARENTVDLRAKRMEAVGGCRKNFVGGKCRIMNGEMKDWEEKETERGENVQNWMQKYPYDRRNREINFKV